MSLQNQKCIFCDLRYSTRKGDHVPPQSFFPDSRGFPLIQVPCCGQCNNIFSEVDDYVRDYLSGEFQSEKHPTIVNQVQEKRNRSWDHNPKKGWDFFYSISPKPTNIEIGGKIIEGHVMDFNKPQFDLFFQRMTKGLLWKEYNIKSIGRQFEWFPVYSMNQEAKDQFVNMVNHGEFQVIGNKEFQYRGVNIPDSDRSVWWMCFYEGMEVCSTLY